MKMEFNDFKDHYLMNSLAVEAFLDVRADIFAMIAESPNRESPDVQMLLTWAEHTMPFMIKYLYTWRYGGMDAAIAAQREKIRISWMLKNTTYFKLDMYHLSALLSLRENEPRIWEILECQPGFLAGGLAIEFLNGWTAMMASPLARDIDAANAALATFDVTQGAVEMVKEYVDEKVRTTYDIAKAPSIQHYKPVFQGRWLQLFRAALDSGAECVAIREDGEIVAYKTNAFASCLDGRGREGPPPPTLTWEARTHLIAAVPASAVDASQEYFETVASKLLPSQILQSALTYDLHSKSSGGGHVPVGQRLPSTQTGGSSSAATNQRSRPRLRERQQDEADPSWVKWTGPDLEAEKSRCGGGALVMRVSDILLRLRFRRAKTSTFGLIMGPQRASNLGFDTTISSPTTS